MKPNPMIALSSLLLTIALVACPQQPAPDFTVTLSPAANGLVLGGNLTVAVSLSRAGGFAEAVNLALSSPPAGITAEAMSIAGNASSGRLFVKADQTATPGEKTLTVNATGANLTRTATIKLSVLQLDPPKVTVDASLKPVIASIPDPNGGPPRPLAALSSRSGGQSDFVLNEMLIVTDDRPKLDALLARWGGKIVLETNLDEIAKIFKSGNAKGPHYYLVRVDPAAADTAGLPEDLQKLSNTATGEFRISSQDALKFLSAVASEASDPGMTVGANLIVHPASIATGSTTEGTSSAAGYSRDVFTWDYMGSGSAFPMDTGVAQAWQQLRTAGRFVNRVGVLVADGGFSPSIAGPDLPGVTAFGATEAPNPFPCVGAGGATGPCRWHGSHVMQALAAVPDNGIGVAGPAGPVADLSFVQSPIAGVGPGLDIGGVISTIGSSLDYAAHLVDALSRRPHILNFSGSFKVDGGWGFLVSPLNPMFSFFKDSLGILTFAAAGNDGAIDVDAEKCYFEPFDCLGGAARGEADVFVPCEVSAVICVAGLGVNAAVKDPGSSFGSRQRFSGEVSDDPGANDASVDIYAPFSVWVGPDPDDTTVRRDSGTSFSSPFVAGVAALIWAADPSLTADQVQRILLETAHHTNNITGTIGGLRVNALGAIQRLLGHPPTLALSRFGFAFIAPLNRDFQINALASDPDGTGCCTTTWDTAPGTDIPIVGGRRGTFRFTTAGDKTITATARDATGNTVSASITITVQNNPPIATMSLPATNINVSVDQPVQFRGFATDANEGPGPDSGTLACSRLTWRSSNPADVGFPVTGSGTAPNCDLSFTFTTPGPRSISLVATDAQGLVNFAPPGRLITVDPAPTNRAPNITVGTLPPTTYSSGYAWDQPIPIMASATDTEGNTPITYRWIATSYRPNSATVFAGPTTIAGPTTATGNLNWTPSSNAALFGSFTDFGNDCYQGQDVKLVIETKDSLGNTSSVTLPTIKIFRCILI